MFTISARVKDISQRSLKTGVQAFFGAIATAQLAGQEITISILGAALLAAVAAVFSAVWNITVKQV